MSGGCHYWVDKSVRPWGLVLRIVFALTLSDIFDSGLFGNKGALVASLWHSFVSGLTLFGTQEERRALLIRPRSAQAVWDGRQDIEVPRVRCFLSRSQCVTLSPLRGPTPLLLPPPVYRWENWGPIKLGSKKAHFIPWLLESRVRTLSPYAVKREVLSCRGYWQSERGTTPRGAQEVRTVGPLGGQSS